ncbi:MAG: hypothetical protein M9939_02150 [Mesorhizobium sp.]|nr:hypothetical protein [Mesorhizobium sp.]MCO5159911.1 hypothetical protein [Mesorhizobium sp.]
MQTAELAGIGRPAIKALFEDLSARAEPALAAVVAALPSGFPGDLVESVANALAHRARLLADVDPE